MITPMSLPRSAPPRKWLCTRPSLPVQPGMAQKRTWSGLSGGGRKASPKPTLDQVLQVSTSLQSAWAPPITPLVVARHAPP